MTRPRRWAKTLSSPGRPRLDGGALQAVGDFGPTPELDPVQVATVTERLIERGALDEIGPYLFGTPEFPARIANNQAVAS